MLSTAGSGQRGVGGGQHSCPAARLRLLAICSLSNCCLTRCWPAPTRSASGAARPAARQQCSSGVASGFEWASTGGRRPAAAGTSGRKGGQQQPPPWRDQHCGGISTGPDHPSAAVEACTCATQPADPSNITPRWACSTARPPPTCLDDVVAFAVVEHAGVQEDASLFVQHLMGGRASSCSGARELGGMCGVHRRCQVGYECCTGAWRPPSAALTPCTCPQQPAAAHLDARRAGRIALRLQRAVGRGRHASRGGARRVCSTGRRGRGRRSWAAPEAFVVQLPDMRCRSSAQRLAGGRCGVPATPVRENRPGAHKPLHRLLGRNMLTL